LKALSYAFAALLLLLVLLFTLPFTSPGTRLLLQLAERTGLVVVQYQAGSLFGDLTLAQLSVNAGPVSLRLEQVESRLDTECFWASTFCFDTLHAQSLTVNIVDQDGPVDAADSDDAVGEMLVIPYAYALPDVRLQQLTVNWPGGQLQQRDLHAQLDIAGSRITVLRAEAGASTLQLTSDTQPESSYTGFEPPAIFLPLELLVEHLILQQPQVVLADSQYVLQSLALTGSWRGPTLQLAELSAAAEGAGVIAASGSLVFQQQWPLQLLADIALDQELLQPQLRGRNLQLQLGGDLQALQVSLDSAGYPDISGAGEVSVVTPGLPFTGDASLKWPEQTRLGEIIPLAEPFAGLLLASPLKAAVSGNLEEQNIDLAGQFSGQGYAALALSLQGRLQSSQLFIESLELFDEASDSSLQASGELSLGMPWSVTASARSDGIYIPPVFARDPGRLRGAISVLASGDGDGWRLELPAVNLQGTVNGLPAEVQGYAGITSSLRLLPGELRADLNGAQLAFDGGQGTGNEAQFSLRLDDLGRWVAGARGRLELQGSGGLERQVMSIEGRASDILLADMDIPEATLRLDYAAVDQDIDMLLQIPSIRSGSYSLEAVTLALLGSASSHRLVLSSAGRVEGELQLDGTLLGDQWQGSLQPVQLATSAGPWSLATAVEMNWDAQLGALRIAGHCWQHPDFELCADSLQVGRTGDVDVRLSGDVSAFNGLLPPGLRVRGGLNSNLALDWNEERPLGLEGAARVRGLQVDRLYGMGEKVSVAWESADFDFAREGESLAVSADVLREGRRVLVADVLLPRAADQPISGSLVLDGLQLSTFSPWVTELSTLQGTVSGRLQLQGSATSPQAVGSLRLRDGKLVVVGNPTELTALSLDLQLDGTSGQLQGEGLLGGGEVRLRGNILSRPQLSLDLAISGEGHQILLPPASEMLVSEELSLLLTEDLLDVGGDIHVLEGVLRHEELPEGSIGISRDVVQVDLRGNVIGEEKPFDVRADIMLNIRDRFRVEGDGISATLGGDLQLRQERGKALQVFGNLNLQGGELFVYRQHLQVRRGTIAFSGPPENPELNIAAEREIRSDGVTVGARLTGPLEEPLLEVYSDPVMSQGEAMSYLVRGRALDSGAGSDGTALALLVGADVVNRSGIVAGLNQLPLISNFAFGASGEQDDTAATVSGYIGNRIYLSYGIGLYEPINVLTARLYLQSRLWLEVMSRLENSVDLYYSFDIR
jgi:autotransporter translocation and assembly factor TamB